MKIKILIGLILFVTANLQAQNTAHKGWDLQDKPVRRSIWSWRGYEENQDLIIDFCRNKSINEIYLYVGEYYWGRDIIFKNEAALAAFIEKANAAGIKIWGCYYFWDNDEGLNYLGDLDKDEHIETARKVMDAAAAFNRKYPHAGLHGMQNDNEPKYDELMVPFIEYCKAANDRAIAWNDTLIAEGARPLLHSAALRPSWITRIKADYNGSNNFVAYHYLTECNHGTVMNYTSNGNNFKKWGETILQWADDIEGDQRVVLGVETNDIIGRWPSAINETYADEIMEEDDLTRFNHFESDMDAAELSFMNYQSYDRIAMHSMRGYFDHWFQGKTWDEVGSAPWRTEFVDLNHDQSPWAEATERIEYAPVAENDSFVATSGRLLQLSVENGILINDSDYNKDTLSVQLEDSTEYGELNLLAEGTFTYQPDPGFLGLDSFRYVALDNSAQSKTATVKIFVIEEASPVSEPDVYKAYSGEILSVTAPLGVLSNDTDLNLDTLSTSLVDSTFYGALYLSADGSFDYIPGEGFNGVDSFSYLAYDGSSFGDTTWVTLYVKDLSSGILVAYWPFNGNTQDLSENALHGQASSVMSYEDGKFGKGISFTEDEQTLDIFSDSIPSPWTVSIWVKRSGDHSSTHLLGNERVSLKIEQWGTGSEVGYTEYTVKDHSFGYVVPLNTWTHLAITCDDDQLTLFVNGEENSSISGSFELGMDQIGEPERGEALGSIDDFAIWNRLLSTEEIKTIHTQAEAGISLGNSLGIVSVQEKKVEDAASFLLFPNPAKDVLYVEALPANSTLSLYNTSGSCLFTGLYSERAAINLTDFAEGLYFIRIESDTQSSFNKFIKN